MDKKIIIVLGPQGSGKSVQAELLADKINYKFISSGELLRHMRDGDNPLGQKLANYWLKGELVPDDIIEDIIFGIFQKEDIKGFVVDGFPRNESQYKALYAAAEINNWNVLNVIYLKVGEEECVKRIRKRRVIEKRPDATDEALKTRLSIYNNETKKLVSKFMNTGILIEIDGERSIEDIHQDIYNIVKDVV